MSFVLQIAPFDPTKKKKKKKVVIQDPADDPVSELAEKTESLSGKLFHFQRVTCALVFWLLPLCWHMRAVSDGLETTFVGLKKKKKKPVSTLLFMFIWTI